MIFGIGTDIVRVTRMQRNLDRYGERFAERILSETELAEFCDNARPAHFLARRFAAKEAAAKAMGTGFRDGIALRQIAVTHNEHGRPALDFTGAAADFLRSQGITASHLSISDEEDHAVAFVTLERA